MDAIVRFFQKGGQECVLSLLQAKLEPSNEEE